MNTIHLKLIVIIVIVKIHTILTTTQIANILPD
jgi:hypothetical protein